MSVIEKNKELAQLWLQLVSEGKIEELCALTHPEWKMYGGPPVMPSGPDGIRFLFGTFDHVDQLWEVNLMLAEGDLVAVRATNTCLQNSFFGIPAQGKQQVFTSTFIFHIVDGLMIQTWRNADDLGRVLQLGAKLVPATAEV
ncbi:ester cyclase [Larkinella terrae]|uniref:Ester cyclase n=1 Tax=Larkinella terrae TaxID=2025311 RepID=A0A7K0ESG2_9BACT|nr:ester cyclase [Larkinella terrae]MRS64754.1 hypothetical protein [Larkinella terrae]